MTILVYACRMEWQTGAGPPLENTPAECPSLEGVEGGSHQTLVATAAPNRPHLDKVCANC